MLLQQMLEALQQRMLGIAFSLLRNYGVLGSASKILAAASHGALSRGRTLTSVLALGSTQFNQSRTKCALQSGSLAYCAGVATLADNAGGSRGAGPSREGGGGSGRAVLVTNIGDGVVEGGKAFARDLAQVGLQGASLSH